MIGRTFTLLTIAVSLIGCGKSDPPATHGTWTLDQAYFENDLDRLCDLVASHDSGADAEEFRKKVEGTYQDHRWVFREDGTYEKVAGSFPSSGTYELFDHGSDWIVFRIFPESTTFEDLLDVEPLNQMDADGVADSIGFTDGEAPFLVGFEFKSDSQAMAFSLKLDGKAITKEREYAYLYNYAP